MLCWVLKKPEIMVLILSMKILTGEKISINQCVKYYSFHGNTVSMVMMI